MSGGGLRTAAAFADLCAVSARLGQDPLQVQGAGGNTSIKAGGAMLVKASGTWLADALTRDVFVDVDAAGYAAALRAGRPEAADAMRFVRSGPTPGGLRPSIETGLHAALRAPVVLHTHCVATIAVAVQSGGAALALRALAGLDAVFVPYARPGIPLAEAMLAAGDDHGVYILGNHGLVVAADTVAAAAALQAEVTRRLAGPVARAPAKPLSLKGTGWAALGPGVPEQAAVLAGRALYPDHVIFLGPGIALPAAGHSDAEAVAAAARAGRKLVLFPGRGAAVPQDASASVRALAGCLVDVAARLPEAPELLRLDAEEEAGLLNWDAEKYRQALDGARP